MGSYAFKSTSTNELMKCLIILGLISFFLIFTPALAQEISKCMNITQSGSYLVTQDLIVPSDRDTCIWINADNVAIDFQGHLISRASGDSRTLIGVRSIGYSGITIKNGAIIGIDYGIVLRGGGFIENMTVRSSNQVGIMITPTSNHYISIKKSDVRYSYVGIHVEAEDSSDVFIEGNNFESNDYTSIEISNIGTNVIFEIDKNRFVGNAFEITASYGDIKSSIVIFDNLFFSPNIRIDGRVASKVYFYTGVRKDGCYYNRLNGCGIGGNFWDGYSQNCKNDNKDSFCDYAYQVPVTEIITNYGITFYDYYPLAYPQPYLCQQLQTNSINIYPTD